MKSKILITGASGFIGTNLLEFFLNTNFAVYNLDTAKPRNHRHREYWREVDICDLPALQSTIDEINPDYLVPGHCAGERFYDLVRAEMPDKVIHAAVGARFVFGA